MALVEYDDALELLKEEFSKAAGGNGQLVLISGSLASGKTELLREFSRHAAGSGTLVLSAAGSAAERTLQASVIDQLLRSAGLPAELIDQASQLVTASEFTPEGDGPAPDGRAARYAGAQAAPGICGVLLELSRDRPMVICVDDVQFADRTSQQFLLYLGRRLSAARVLMVITERGLPRPTSMHFHAEVTRLPHRQIEMAAWSERTIRKVLSSLADPNIALRLARAYHELSGGNPMLLNALIEDHRHGYGDGASGGTQPVVGAAFRQAVLASLYRWEPDLLEVARGLAILNAHASPALIGRLAGMKPESASQAIEILTAAGLLAAGQFRHPAAEAAVLGNISPDQRARMHARAAVLLYEDGAPAVDVAEHLVAADHVVGPWSVGVLRKAAEQALIGDEVSPAARYLELALVACTDEQDRVTIMQALVHAQWRVSPSAAAVHLPRLQGAMLAGRHSDRDVVRLVRYGLWLGDDSMVAKALSVLRDSGGLADPQISVELRLMSQMFYGSADGWAAGRAASVPGKDQRDVTEDAPWPQAANALIDLCANDMSADIGAIASAECILESSCLEGVMIEAVAAALFALLHRDQLIKAASWCDVLVDEATSRGAVTWQAFLCAIRADITLRCGAAAEAAAQAQAALSMLSAQSWGVLIGYPLSTLLSANVSMGRYDSAASVLRRFVPDAMFKTAIGASYLHSRGHYYLATNRALAAAVDFRACGDLMGRLGIDSPAVVPWRSDLAEAYLRLGRDAEARGLAVHQLERALGASSRSRGISLRVLAACSEEAERSGLLRGAVENLQASGDRLELAHALVDLNRVNAEMSGSDRALVTPRSVVQGTRRLYSGRPVVPAHLTQVSPHGEELAIEPGHRAIPLVLSDAERRVAVLAAAGHTNREIGRRLWVTVSTVEQHLTRVYRKLGLNGRADLPGALPLDGAFAAVSEMEGDESALG